MVCCYTAVWLTKCQEQMMAVHAWCEALARKAAQKQRGRAAKYEAQDTGQGQAHLLPAGF